MTEPRPLTRPRRSYPAAYEKLIPVALAVITALALVAILFALAVTLQLLPGIAP